MPLYAQLAAFLLKEIKGGVFLVGKRIPSENVLAEQFGIGRPTVRQATDTLVRQGYLQRRRGAGTYVRERSPDVDLFSLGSTLESFSRQGIELSTRLVKAPHLVEAHEGGTHPLSNRSTYHLVRLGSVDGEPVLLERFWFLADIFPFFDQLQVAGRSLSEAVVQRYQLVVSSAEQRFSVRRASDAESALLELEKDESLLQVERELHFFTAKSAVFAQMVCRGDKFTFSQHINALGE